MTPLRNPRHEKFSQLVASGIKPAEVYVSLGYSQGGAPQSANKLLKRTDVRERVNEIQSLAARSTAEEVAFDQKRVLSRLDVLSRKAEDLGQISAAAKCEELIGKQRGMFVDRSAHTFQWDDITKLSDDQLGMMADYMLHIGCGGDPQKIAETRRQIEAEFAAGMVIDVSTETTSLSDEPGSPSL